MHLVLIYPQQKCFLHQQDGHGGSLGAIFIHLSDIHFGQEKTVGDVFVNNDARDQLIDDASKIMRSLGRKADGIIVTGDIAYSGKPQQYKDAATWLDLLAEKVGGEIYEVQVVPGNHDIDRDEITGATKLMLDEVVAKGESELNKFLEEEGDRELLYRRFKAYRDFANGYRCPLDCSGGNSNDFRFELAPNRKIRFVRFNSALICSFNDDKGKLILGARQRILPTVEPGEEIIVLTHHPLDWFQDSGEAEKYLRGRARVIISGHEHYPSLVVENVEPGSDLMQLAAGATTPDGFDDIFTYKYNIIEFDWDVYKDALAVTLHSRTWNDKLKRFGEDEVFLEGKDIPTILASPNFRALQLGNNEDTLHDNINLSKSVTESSQISLNKSEISENRCSPEQKLLQLRFFRDLSEGERLKILLELEMIPDDLQETLNHGIEQSLFSSIFEKGQSKKLKSLIDDTLNIKKEKLNG